MLSVASTALGMARDAEKCMTSAADSTWTPMPYKNLDKNREYQREYSRRWRVAHPRTRKTVAERFWERVDKCGPLPRADAVAVYPEIAGICCWLWLGAKDRDGYGQTSLDGKSKKAHRVSWFLEHGAGKGCIYMQWDFNQIGGVPMGNVKCLCPAPLIQAQSVSSDYFISMVHGYEKKYDTDWLTFYTDHQHSKEELNED